ncbi:uncharacterized protein LOC106668957 [Cimex lectularius]|uniref:CPR type cuticle protein n=1 Tax=Cimex lectularius TaxID=79782 RepID=A0A8I6RXS5_CIMLE|nr:uncharacterized protein LOC106668957 [Cimex lectularius]
MKILNHLIALVFWPSLCLAYPPMRPVQKSLTYFGSYGEIGRAGPEGGFQAYTQYGQGGNGGLSFDIPVYSYIDGLGSLGNGDGQKGDDYPGYGYGLGYFGGLPTYLQKYYGSQKKY